MAEDNDEAGKMIKPWSIVQLPVRPSAANPGRVTNQLMFLNTVVVKALWRHQFSSPFRNPVDPEQHPKYYAIIENPMDLSTIKKRLQNNFYWSAKECIKDLILCFNNYVISFKADDDITVMAKTLEKVLMSKLSGLPDEEIELTEKEASEGQQDAHNRPYRASRPAQPLVYPKPDCSIRLTNQLIFLKKIVIELWNEDLSCPFRRPADPKLVPDYYTIVETPMDLDIIRRRLKNYYYWSGSECIQDIVLCFSNYILSCKERDKFFYSAKVMEKRFATMLDDLPTEEVVIDLPQQNGLHRMRCRGQENETKATLVPPNLTDGLPLPEYIQIEPVAMEADRTMHNASEVLALKIDSTVFQPPVERDRGRPGRVTNHLIFLQKLLNMLWRHKFSGPFQKPAEVQYVPKYYSLVKHPMDLGTIKQRLENNYYWSGDDCIQDVLLCFSNYDLCGKQGDNILFMAKTLQKLFTMKLASLPDDEYVVDSPELNEQEKPTIPKKQPDTATATSTISFSQDASPFKENSGSNREGASEVMDELCINPWDIQLPVYPSSDHPGRLTNQLIFLEKVLKNDLWNHQFSWPFQEPANIKKLPDYYKVVKEPMDLGTIMERLQNKYYWSGEECIQDVLLCFSNYNLCCKQGEYILVMAKTLQELFFSTLADFPKEEIAVEQPQQHWCLNPDMAEKDSPSSPDSSPEDHALSQQHSRDTSSKKETESKRKASVTSRKCTLRQRKVVQPSMDREPNHTDRVTNQLLYLEEEVMKALWKHQFSWLFNHSVDPDKMPKYYAAVKRPMDLGTIKKRLENRYYWSAADCVRDLKLCFNNYTLCCEPDDSILVMAKALERLMFDKLAGIPKEEIEVDTSELKKADSSSKQSPLPSQETAVIEDTSQQTKRKKRKADEMTFHKKTSKKSKSETDF